MKHQVLGDALGEVFKVNSPTLGYGNVLQGKGGFWVKGHGFVTIAKARKLTGITAPPRPRHAYQLPWGDYATIAMLNRPRKAKEV